MFPTGGVHISMDLDAYKGMGDYARDYARITPEIAVYQSLNARKTVVVSNRIGGIISVGQPAFYQSAFLGGQGNLLGFRQYRFAGRHAAFDNFECRVKLAEVSSYILPGELGLSGFFDIGRVWDNNDHSDTWHNGAGAGIYYIPAQLAVFRLIAGHSSEGWYPYISMGIRF
jgi:outer membrane translocation and assembly module TamA